MIAPHWSVLVLAAALPLAGAGCGGGSQSVPDTANAAAAPVEVVDSESRASHSPVRMVPTSETAPDRLGTRTEGTGLPVGATVPDFTVEDASGRNTTLGDLLDGRPRLFVFYRGGWCPFCSHQLHELMAAEDDFEALGVDVVAISVDRVSEASRTVSGIDLPFPVLADPDLRAHEAFDVALSLSVEEVERLREMGLDIEAASGRTHRTMAVPSAFLVSIEYQVLWAHTDVDYRVRPSAEQLVTEVRRVIQETP